MQRNHLFLSPPECGTPLGEELARVFPSLKPRALSDRWWAIDSVPAETDSPALAFALQSLPNALIIPSVSIRKDADAVAVRLREVGGSLDGRWNLQVFAPWEAEIVSAGKAKLFRSTLVDSLKRKAKGLLALLDDSSETASDGRWLVQVTWLSPMTLALSVCDDQCRRFWHRSLSSWPGGVAPISTDKRPPSRAYRKLLEALQQMDRSIGRNQSVVDLGGSPGGWSFIALDRHARVVAVDRSPLRDDLMSHSRLRFIEGDAFKFQPEMPVDWMLADVAAYPERTLELVRRWLSSGWCRSLIATIKFTGTEGYAILEEFKAMLADEAGDFRIRKLLENKNEATVMAWRGTMARTDARNREAVV
jgi:23S rRNA (cytidine2498-2'-O)-methyltransferase